MEANISKDAQKEKGILFGWNIAEGHAREKVWVDTSITRHRQAFIEGVSSGLKHPVGKGRRLIIIHIGSEDGFVPDGLLVFEGKKTSDYHEEMNSNVFEEWFAKILQQSPDNAVIVMDNASYHSRQLEYVTTTTARKTVIQDWLWLKNIEFSEDMVRCELLHLVRMNKPAHKEYVVDEMVSADIYKYIPNF